MQGRWFIELVAVFVGLIVSPCRAGRGTCAHAWWDGKWKYRKKIVLDTTPQGGDVKEALTDFPVLVRLHTGNFTFENAKSDGADIRFVASDDKTPLKYHIERYDPTEEMVLIWVKVPEDRTRLDRRILSGSTTATALPRPERTPGAPSTRPSSSSITSAKRRASPRMPPPIRTTPRSLRESSAPRRAIGRGITLKGEGDRLVIAEIPLPQLREGVHLLRLGPHRPAPRPMAASSPGTTGSSRW